MVSKAYGKSRRRKSKNPLLDKGLNALLFGIGALLVSVLLANNPLFAMAAGALQAVGWFIAAVGVLLLGLHYVLKEQFADNNEAAETLPVQPKKPAQAARLTLVPTVRRNEQLPTSPETTATPAEDNKATRRQPTLEVVRPATTPAPAPPLWSEKVFRAIEWRRFEAVCEVLFSQAGLETKSQSHGPDGGVDLWLYSQHMKGPARVVQCKHWLSKPVGVKELREFFGVMASHQLQRGTFATTSTFTADAKAFAKSNRIHLLDGAALLELIAQRTPEQQEALLNVACEGDYRRPTCASCGIKMVERVSSRAGARFWGCTNYPRCRNRLGMASEVA